MKKTFYTEILNSLSPYMIQTMMDLENDAFPDFGAIDEQTLVPLARFGKIVLYRESGDPRAVAVCELMRDYYMPNRAYIFGYYVRSDQQGKGVGKNFLKELIPIIKEDGFQSVCLTVDINNVPAIKLYENAGFKIMETRKDEFGLGEDRYFMVLDLSA